MSPHTLFALALFYHFLADFILQSGDMAKRKSEEWRILIAHCAIHLAVFFAGFVFILGPLAAIKVALVNAWVHAFIDWNVWRGYKRYAAHRSAGRADQAEPFRWWEDHYFYVTIGADQLLHGLTIVFALRFFGGA